MYNKLGGMTGTAVTEAGEQIYKPRRCRNSYEQRNGKRKEDFIYKTLVKNSMP
jgi:preprotein translocase subunit SecA